MRTRIASLAAILACLILPAAGAAQQGHPLDGIWSGDWGPSANDRFPVVLELRWVNTTLSGSINPGFPDVATLEVGQLNSANWTVHLEASGKDEAGNTVRTVIDGQIDNLGSANRTLTGTWRRGNVTGNFKLTRE
jgi:hypothetical protein